MKFAKALKATFLTNILVFGLGMGTSVITARWLGTGLKGVVSLSSLVVSILLIFLDMGIGSSNTYFIGKSKDDLNAILGCNLTILISEIILLGPLYLIATFFPDFIIVKFLFKNLAGWVLVITLLTIPVSGFKSALTNIVLGMEEYKSYNRLNIVYQVVDFSLLLVFMLWLHFAQTQQAVILVLLANLFALLTVVFCLLRVIRKDRLHVVFQFDMLKIMLRYGIKAQFSNLVQTLTYTFDSLIISFYFTITQVTLYTTAVTHSTMLWQITNTISTLIYPAMSNSDDMEQIKRVTNKTTRISLVVIFLFCGLLALISYPLILILYGKKFLGSVIPLLLLLPGVAFFSVSKILASTLAGVGRVDINLKVSVIISIIAVSLYFLVIPRFGISGAAVASSVVYILQALLTLHYYRQLNGSGVREVLLINKSDWADIRARIAVRLKKA